MWFEFSTMMLWFVVHGWFEVHETLFSEWDCVAQECVLFFFWVDFDVILQFGVFFPSLLFFFFFFFLIFIIIIFLRFIWIILLNLRILNNYRPRLIYGIGLLVRPWLGEGLRDSLILLVMVAWVCLSLLVVNFDHMPSLAYTSKT